MILNAIRVQAGMKYAASSVPLSELIASVRPCRFPLSRGAPSRRSDGDVTPLNGERQFKPFVYHKAGGGWTANKAPAFGGVFLTLSDVRTGGPANSAVLIGASRRVARPDGPAILLLLTGVFAPPPCCCWRGFLTLFCSAGPASGSASPSGDSLLNGVGDNAKVRA